jgi:hypothetical protein
VSCQAAVDSANPNAYQLSNRLLGLKTISKTPGGLQNAPF